MKSCMPITESLELRVTEVRVGMMPKARSPMLSTFSPSTRVTSSWPWKAIMATSATG